jgi:hypothetical protein
VLAVWYRYPRGDEDRVAPSCHAFEFLDNVIMTPLPSAWTDGLLDRRWTAIADNKDRLATGAEPRNRIDGDARPWE